MLPRRGVDALDPQATHVALAVAAVTVMQLVQARDGTTDQRLSDAFDPVERESPLAVVLAQVSEIPRAVAKPPAA